MAYFTRDCVCALAEWQEETDLQDAAVSAMALASLALNTDGGGIPLEPWVEALLSPPGPYRSRPGPAITTNAHRSQQPKKYQPVASAVPAKDKEEAATAEKAEADDDAIMADARAPPSRPVIGSLSRVLDGEDRDVKIEGGSFFERALTHLAGRAGGDWAEDDSYAVVLVAECAAELLLTLRSKGYLPSAEQAAATAAAAAVTAAAAAAASAAAQAKVGAGALGKATTTTGAAAIRGSTGPLDTANGTLSSPSPGKVMSPFLYGGSPGSGSFSVARSPGGTGGNGEGSGGGGGSSGDGSLDGGGVVSMAVRRA